ncbi:aqualysin-1-like [Ptychodera flava]|uniref:aqualysin-1-like n=1 Tax=Ptychodera flava TaxID=63121 RepID=UPI00396A8DE4
MRLLLLALFVASAAAVELVPILSVQESVPNRYMIKIKDGYTVADLLKRLPKQAELKRTYEAVFNGIAVEAPKDVIQRMRNVDIIEYIEEDSIMRAACEWGCDRSNQRALPLDNNCNYYGNGAGARVYVADTGIRHSHVEFGGRADYFWDFDPSNGGEDCHGHGTHCAGTAAGEDVGIANGALVYSVRVLNCIGLGLTSNIVGGINAIAEGGTTPGIVSMSLGGGANQAMDDATRGVIAAGYPTAVAAGNDNRDACLSSPARVAEAETVGSTTSTDARSGFSNFGTCLDLFAPGSNVRSAYHTSDTAYQTMSGTSMACPHVAGVMTLHVASNRCSTGANCKTFLREESTKGAVSNPGTGSPNRLLYSD